MARLDRFTWGANWDLVGEKAAAEYLGLSVRTLQNWRVRGDGPPFVRLSKRAVRYRFADLDFWVSARIFSSTTAADYDWKPPVNS